ncbi:MAG TPA: diguanylate cyclase [Roseateles sp.]|nr:diguanylate cyclase [Roseateles sp.]
MSQDKQDANADLWALLGRPPCLLVAADGAADAQALQLLFASDGRILVAQGAEQALALALAELPDLLLLDLQKEGQDGAAVCARIHADERLAATPVILLVDRQDLAAESRALACGALDCLGKPVNGELARLRVQAHLRLKLQAELLSQTAYVDGLTGLPNKPFFDDRFDAELRRARRSGGPLAVLLADVDFLERYNEHYGRPAGDDALRGVAVALRSTLKRPGDLLCRYGLRGFAMLLPETDLDGARATARQLEASVRALRSPHAHSDAAEVLSISLGGTVCVPGARHDCELLLHAAGSSLAEAKLQGRARTVLAAL